MYPTQEERNEAKKQKRETVTLQLAAALKTAGIKHETFQSQSTWDPGTLIRLKNTSVRVDVVIDRGRRFASTPDKARIKVQGHRFKVKQFPERKDGFDYKAITDYILQDIQAEKDTRAWEEKSRVEDQKADAAEADLRARYKGFIRSNSLFYIDLEPAGTVYVSHTGTTEKFKLEISYIHAETADKILEILTDKFGVLVTKAEEAS